GYTEVGNGLMELANQRGTMALNILDLMMEKFPYTSYPYDYNMMNTANYYQMLGKNENAIDIIKKVTETCLDDLTYYYKMYNVSAENYLTRMQYETEMRDAERCLASAVNIARKAGEADLATYIQTQWDSLRGVNGLPSVLENNAPAK
ncbi:MAG: hypothetical protein ACK4IY_06800, partial [Chitinophagales bacterium]